ncbi:hypothetical protein FCH28_33575 [Streptomyces piniterrae]|uniref:Secreted protein n=1 Tax=Streptomyces piniterrae TaxID=2571125 RepID=A0A4U0MZW8_9ACTN|nr:hypothetical protein [Streptomyces piniterrae]TJZ42824.1 hypothetical protein FCH28_33575 [Streptomyces piniterrae]
MRKLHKAALVAAVLASVGILGAGTATADGHGGKGGKKGGGDITITQGSSCRSHDTNVDVLGEVGVLNGLAGNLLGGEGSPGAQSTHLGSTMGCDNSVGGDK